MTLKQHETVDFFRSNEIGAKRNKSPSFTNQNASSEGRYAPFNEARNFAEFTISQETIKNKTHRVQE
jgi:hypothetical protein